MKELPPSSRIDTSAPFHVELKAAFDGVSKAIAAVEKITASQDFPRFKTAEPDYSGMIGATLIVDIDRLKRMVDPIHLGAGWDR